MDLDRWIACRGLATATVAGLLLCSSGVAVSAQSSSEASGGSGTLFASAKRPYTLVLPGGWRVVPASQEAGSECCDVFEGGGLTASLNAGEVPPGSIVEDRVAGNRARDAAGGICTSDPTDDRPTDLGGERAIAWSRTCPDRFNHIVQAIHDDVSYHLQVIVPIDSEIDPPQLLEQFRSTFAFVDEAASPAPDLGAIEGQLQGTWQTEWIPGELVVATTRAAGLEVPPEALELIDSTFRWAVKFDQSDLTQYGAIDGGRLEVGWIGTYALVDPDTIQAVAADTMGEIVYDFDLRDDILTIDVISDSEPGDIVAQTGIYETLPFTRLP